MALKLTVYINDEDDSFDALEGSPQVEVNRAADRILSLACKHADFFIYRTGDASVSPS